MRYDIMHTIEKYVSPLREMAVFLGEDEMNGFVDIHTHILPGVDDGAQDMSQAMQLLRMAWENGTRAIVMTPHYRGKYKLNTPDQLNENYAWLCEMIKEDLPEMRLYLGNEISYEADVPEAMRTGRVLTLNNSQYALLEFCTGSLRSQLIYGVSETIRCGFIPIVAHLERYEICRKEPDLADELLQMGALLQLNADGVMGKYGFGVKRFCHKVLKMGMVHFIASDAHDIKRRPPLLRNCFLRVCKKYGQEYAYALFYGNAQAIIENRIIN